MNKLEEHWREKLANEFALERYGVRLVPNVLTEDQAHNVRAEIFDNFPDKRVVQLQDLLEKQCLVSGILSNTPLNNALAQAFEGAYVPLPNFHFQLNSFTQAARAKATSGLHIDAAAQLQQGNREIQRVKPHWLNVGLYFQDVRNGGWGGGITVVLRSHKYVRQLSLVPLIGWWLAKFVVKVAKRITPTSLLFDVPTRPGDAVIFDNRLLHASSVGQKSIDLLAKIAKGHNEIGQRHLAEAKGCEKLAMYCFFTRLESLTEVMQQNFVTHSERQKHQKIETEFDYRPVIDNQYTTQFSGLFANYSPKSLDNE